MLRGLPVALLLVAACSAPRSMRSSAERPNLAPPAAPPAAEAIKLDGSQIQPMYRERLAIDLATAIRVAAAQNADIRMAGEQVEASRGRLESALGAAFPAVAPTAALEHVAGTVRATEGNLVGVGFNTFQPAVAVQWILNPGRVAYDIIAARKRLYASEHLERAVVSETLRKTAVQYHDLVLTQAGVAAAQQGVAEAEELLRISRLRVQTGTGVPADELRAQARLAERRQQLVSALNAFYENSVALAVTLHLDASVTLIPKIDAVTPIALVREELAIDDLLALAVRFRPDLERVRSLVDAASADRAATWWGAWGPQFQVAYQYGGLTGHANNVNKAQGIPGNLIVNPLSANGSFSTVPLANGLIREEISRGSLQLAHDRDKTFGLSHQERFNSSAGWRWSLAAFGDLKSARATETQAIIEAERRLDEVKAQVVTAMQASIAGRQTIPLAHDQVASAREGLRLTQANLQAGTMTTLDVLQAEDALMRARLNYAEAVVRFNQAQVNLLGSLGLLDEAALQAAVAQTEPSDSGG